MNDERNIEESSIRFSNTALFCRAVEAIDAANAEDPTTLEVDGCEQPSELYLSKVLFDWVLKLEPKASEALLLAARSQHICRWQSLRNDYPEGRAGYLKWRSDLKKFHADKSAEILLSIGYEEGIISAVCDLNLKKNLKSNADCQVLEDALCLVFLEKQFAQFRLKTDEEKMIGILRKTWAKMSDRGRAAALSLPMGDEESRIVGLAIG